MDISRYTLALQLVECQQQAPVIFYHPLAVTILVVQWKHDTYADGIGWHRRNRLGRFSGLGVFPHHCSVRPEVTLLGERDKNQVAFLQLIAWLFHGGIRIKELRNGNAILFCNAEDGLLAFYLVLVAPLDTLCEDAITECHSE